MLSRLFRHPRAIIMAVLSASILLGWQGRHFEINASAETLISDNNRDYLESRKINQRFAPEEFLLVVYEPRNHALFSEKSFADIRELTEKLSALERVETVRSILNVPLLSELDALAGEVNPEDYTQNRLQLPAERLSDIFRNHPIYEGLIVDREQTASAIQLLYRQNPKLEALESRITTLKLKALDETLSYEETLELEKLVRQAEPLRSELREQRHREVEHILEIIEPYRSEAELYLGGVQVLGYELISIIKRDLALFGSAIAVVICLVLALLFRSVRWVLIPVVCCASSVALTLGLFGLLGLKATVISSSFVALQLILTLAIVIHLIVQYRESLRKLPDASQYEVVLDSVRRKIAPCLFAAATTSIGFGSLLLSGIQPVISFGWMMVVAMAVSTLCSLLLVPAINLILPRRQAPERNSFFREFIGGCHHLATQKKAAVYPGSALLALAVGAGVMQLSVENSFINYFADDTRIHRELSYVDQKFGGSTPLDIIYRIPRDEQAEIPTLSAETVQRLQRIQHQLEQHEAVGTTLSVVNFTELAKQINQGKPLTEYELTAVYWSLDKSVRRDLLGAFFAPDAQELRISTRIKDSTKNLNRKQLLTDIREDLKQQNIPEKDVKLTNLFVLYQGLLEQLFSSQILTLGAVFAVLGVAFALIFRSLKLALIALVPNSFTALFVLGSMGWLNVPLDFMTITIAAIAVGIAVDDTIHYIHRFLEERERGGDATEICDRTHHAVGYALLYTSLIVIFGFALLAFSDFTPSIMFGAFTGLAMGIAMLTDLTLLPALLHQFAGKPSKNP
ncbi:hypothetical protein FHR99_002066 [Litorivivens lipolytica]|uniref:SSD domain-containing protein n=1 Tax=Litorivivens lipolytica TaxID=1524264 RepID=A0A7W4W5H0_9GAMM|nr:MMPL family transporter [Litorivivens lipolytica]MBB3047800.1 hypothetical protein [Litorivivens lipolytica]